MGAINCFRFMMKHELIDWGPDKSVTCMDGTHPECAYFCSFRDMLMCDPRIFKEWMKYDIPCSEYWMQENLGYAAMWGDVTTIKLILDRGLGPNDTPVEWNETPLQLAVQRKNWEVVEFLLEQEGIEVQ